MRRINSSRAVSEPGMPIAHRVYKMLSRVLPQCSHLIAPLEEKIGRLKSTDKIVWSNTQLDHLKAAEKALESRKSVALLKRSDQLWIEIEDHVPFRVGDRTLVLLLCVY
jgi:hypothetical protein